ncbi:winged helix-turn-helix transcriptional regulator [Patescibacteria group bacterium]|nr:winged helix-turn-helix transcriptional regulator [Patescibacteria group bacterium]
MHEQILEKLFESPAKTRLLKLFLRNTETFFSASEIKRRTQLDARSISKQLDIFRSIGLIKTSTRKREKVFGVNPAFVFYDELSSLVLKSSPASKEKMTNKIRGLGKIKMAVLSGIFMQENIGNRRVDILLVGDAISDRKLANFIQALEAEAGTEISFAVLTSEEFIYRYKMFDKFVHDILEKPHDKIINKLEKSISG